MSDDTMTPERVVRRGSGEHGTVSLSGIEGRGRAVQPPRWRGWRDWDLLKVLKVSYWVIKIVDVFGKLLGVIRERFRPA